MVIKWFSALAKMEYLQDEDNFTIVNDRVYHYTGQYVGRISPKTNPVNNAGIRSMYPM